MIPRPTPARLAELEALYGRALDDPDQTVAEYSQTELLAEIRALRAELRASERSGCLREPGHAWVSRSTHEFCTYCGATR